MHSAEGFLLLSLPHATLKNSTHTFTECLYLECITIPTSKSPFPDRDVYLVLRISNLEIAIDPSRTIKSSVQHNTQIYTFHATEQQERFEISVPLPHNDDTAQDLETFDHILSQYAHFTSYQSTLGFGADVKVDRSASPIPTANDYQDLRGKLVLINESDGQVVGELDNQFNIHEDPALTHGLGPNDNVVLELPPDYEIGAPHTGGSRAREAFVRSVPPGERDILTNTASLVSHAISATTTLLLSGVTYASNYYIKNSQPSTPTPSSSSSIPSGGTRSPPHGVVISNPRARSALSNAHAVSGKAVKISGKTVEIVEGLIKKAVGAKDRPSSRPKRLHPLAHHPDTQEKSPLHSEKGESPYPAVRGPGDSTQGPPPLPERLPLRKRDRIILSADLILSTIEESARAAIDVGQQEITKVVTHKRGEEAGQNAALATGTARNVALVYIDMRGVGRRAILKTTGKEFVKARVRSGRPPPNGSSVPSPISQTPSASSSTLVPPYSEYPAHGHATRGIPPPTPRRPDDKKD